VVVKVTDDEPIVIEKFCADGVIATHPGYLRPIEVHRQAMDQAVEAVLEEYAKQYAQGQYFTHHSISAEAS
jgi:hypothetical protein